MIGGGGPRRTPALAARYAAEFNAPFRSLDSFVELRAGVVAACEAIDRDPSSITFSAALVVAVGEDEAEYGRRAAAIGREPDELRENGVAGTADEVTATIERWHDAGAERLYLQVLDLADLDHLDLIASLASRELVVRCDLTGTISRGDLAGEELLGERDGVRSVGGEDVPERESAGLVEGVARRVVEVPLVGPHRPMEPHRVVEAGAVELLVVVGPAVGMAADHRVGRHVVRHERRPAEVVERRRRVVEIAQPLVELDPSKDATGSGLPDRRTTTAARRGERSGPSHESCASSSGPGHVRHRDRLQRLATARRLGTTLRD